MTWHTSQSFADQVALAKPLGDKNMEHAFVCSADLYFMVDDVYKFDPRELPKAHAWCLDNYLWAIEQKRWPIVIDNTNIRLWEFSHYIKIGKMFDLEFQILTWRPTTIEEARICAVRTQHGVPADVVYRMCCELEPYEGETVFPIGE